MHNELNILYVFLGGGVGSVLRYLVSLVWKHCQDCCSCCASTAFPWPTLVVNVLGCFLIGLFYQFSSVWGLSPSARLLLTTGLCGGFTTFSTFSYEGLTLLRSGLYGTFVLYFLLSLLLGLVAVSIPVCMGQK